MTKPKVCYLRGSYLNPFETQYLTPLLDEFDIVLAHPKSHRFDLSSISLPRIELSCLDFLNGFVPRKIFGRNIPNPLKYFGYEEVLLNLDHHLSSFDLIHAPEQTFFFTWQAANKKRKIGYRLITTQDEVNPFWYLSKSAVTKRAAKVRNETDLFIARTLRAKNALTSESVGAEKIRIIGHGVDLENFHPGPRNIQLCKSLGIDSDRFIILFVGRLVWTKGIYAIADAANLLLQDKQIRKLDPLFLMVGDGNERPNFLKKIKILGIESSFSLIGQQPYDALPDLHRLADIFILPSISTRFILEQFGIALIESMATGKPVISTHCGAIDEVIGDAGIVVQPNDYYRLYLAIYGLCQNENMRIKYGKLGLNRVRRFFTHNIIASAIGSAYREALRI